MNLDKYKFKNRLLLVETSNYTNENYKKIKEFYQKHIKEFHKRYIKLITYRKKELKFNIKLIGFDGSIKKEYIRMNKKNIFELVDKMPMAKLLQKYPNIKPQNLSLYSDYNKDTTTPNLGYGSKEKALYTIKTIKNRPLQYQVSVISTMYGRAKNHKYRTTGMEDAMKLFKKWLDNYHKSK